MSKDRFMNQCITLLGLCFVSFSNYADAAEIVGPEVLLCNNGYSTDGSTCTPYAQGVCASGSYQVTTSDIAFLTPDAGTGSCSNAGYHTYSLTYSGVTLTTGGVVSGAEVTLCDNGYSTNGTTCTTYTQGSCESGSHLVSISAVAFLSPDAGTGTCSIPGYQPRTITYAGLSLTTNGVEWGTGPTLCINGFSADGSNCSAYVQNNCSTGYHDMGLNVNTFAEKSGSCSSGYETYVADSECEWGTDTATCLNFCSGAQLKSAGQCATLCGAGITKLHVGNSLVYPLWATKQTTPSLNFGYNNQVCYVNMVQGTTSDVALRLDVNGTLYYATK